MPARRASSATWSPRRCAGSIRSIRAESTRQRARTARKAIGRGRALFVDANGAYSRKQALRFARDFAEEGVSWFEEPVVKTDLQGLRLVRDAAPMEVTGGEYAWEPHDLRELL